VRLIREGVFNILMIIIREGIYKQDVRGRRDAKEREDID
jgi:hypothetical protein